ncbi:aminotransferase class I/II-fold pyridoxal phosphate-dependent enzyme [Mucilaginibacter sp. RCC_168]|uniref:aminotransferase class I/II-fold pyridoxal phosphate-dependent enzyme n=1 Tax=Mucilaginibacter sp. RCC_168 TaxID=3239221 RepID=UPI003524385E
MNFNEINQNYTTYTDADHETWGILFKRHVLSHKKLSKEYVIGFQKLNLQPDRIANVEVINEQLKELSGWTLLPVIESISPRDFFLLISCKKYPVISTIRKRDEIDFSKHPDIFHDVCGQVPLLINEKFTKLLASFSIIALKYINNKKAIDLLSRLWEYTSKMGLILENKALKPYHGAIITSDQEIDFSRYKTIPKYKLALKNIFLQKKSTFKLQNECFVIESFDDLSNCLHSLEEVLLQELSLPNGELVLRNYSLNNNIGKRFNNVIGFLNDVQFKFPKAISFAAGQPDENYFEIESHLSKFDLFVNHVVLKTGINRTKVINTIGQYNKTKGIINDVLVEYLKIDEDIYLKESDLIVTVGAQEAFSIVLSTICNRTTDVILVEDPSYIGVSSFAKVFDFTISGVKTDMNGLDLEALKNKIIKTNESGKKVKLVYVIPDYQNPSGFCMPIGNRLSLLELAEEYNFLIIEDSVYNSFTDAQKRNPTLKSLDKNRRVIFVGSFSKSLFPGLRLGFIGADQIVENDIGESVPLVDQMAKVKALLTNNTPTINQAILGGILIHQNYSLQEWSKPRYESYKAKKNKMLDSLNTHIKLFSDTWSREIHWNQPDGGFFIKMTVPFEITPESIYECARKYNVIFCPMRYFYLENGGEFELRLTFSNLSLNTIDEGIKQLASYFKSVIDKNEEN